MKKKLFLYKINYRNELCPYEVMKKGVNSYTLAFFI